MTTRGKAALVVVAVLLAVAGGYGVYRLADGSGPTARPGVVDVQKVEADWSYVIPAGTGARLDSGEPVEILPHHIEARVGEVIRIVNEDERGYLLGPFYVGPRETLSQRFTAPGTFRGECAVHPSGELLLVVKS